MLATVHYRETKSHYSLGMLSVGKSITVSLKTGIIGQHNVLTRENRVKVGCLGERVDVGRIVRLHTIKICCTKILRELITF